MEFLFISFFFPPLGGAGSKHSLSIVRGLCERGFVATVLTAASGYVSCSKDNFLEQFVPDHIDVEEFRWSHWPYSPRKLIQYAGKVREVAGIPINALAFHDYRNIYEAARKTLADGEYQFIYSVHGIGAAHLAALKLKKETGLPWVAEFRDPWLHNSIIWKCMKDKSWKLWYRHQRRRTERLSRAVVQNADLIVTEYSFHADLLVKDFGVQRDKVVPYGMGYDEAYYSEDEDALVSFTRRPVIGFVGSSYYGYDEVAQNLVLALKELERKGCSFTFVSVGGASSMFSKYARKTNLKSILPVGTLTLSGALSLMRKMDFGLLCVPEEHSNISSKLWEYLKSDLSLIAIAPEGGAIAKMIEEARCGYVLPYNVSGMVSVLENALGDWKQGTTPKADSEFVARLSQNYVTDKLANKLEEMIRRKGL